MTEQEDFEDWLLEAARDNLALLWEKNFDFSDELVFDLVGQLVRSAPAVALVSWLPDDNPEGFSYPVIERPANWRDGDVKGGVFDLVGQLVRSAAPAVVLIAAPWWLDDGKELNYALIKRPANWRDGDMVKLVVIPCRDADQLRRVAIKYGDAGTKKATLQ
jgi:hypothetical protein